MGMYRYWLLLSVLFVIKPPPCIAQTNDSIVVEQSISYTIKPISLPDRVNLNVTVAFVGNASGVTEIALPMDKYGTSNIFESIASLKVDQGQISTVYEKPHVRKIYHRPKDTLTIGYTLSFEPERSKTSSFSPVVEPKLFHFFYPQWTLDLGLDETEEYRYTIQYIDVPQGWTVTSNLPTGRDGRHITVSQPKEFKPFIAGGDYANHEIEIGGKPVRVIISHHFKEDNLLGDVATLLKVQRDFFDFEGNEHYLVSLTYRKGILAGTGIENAFVCFMRKGAPRFKVLNLLAHETLHNWIPLMADIRRDESEVGSEYETEFFNEGITTYAPRVLLYENGLISDGEVVHFLNESLLKYALNPHRNITLDQIKAAERTDTFNNLHEKVSYYRGDLLGYEWDNQIREKTDGKENILHFLKKVIARSIEGGGKISFEDFYGIAEQYGIDAKEDWESHILKGEFIQVTEGGWLSQKYKLVERFGTFYDAGFHVRRSQREKKVIGLVEDSNAYRAGLRNGMEILEMRTSSGSDDQFGIKIKEQGKDRMVEFFPVKEVTYQKFVKRE